VRQRFILSEKKDVVNNWPASVGGREGGRDIDDALCLDTIGKIQVAWLGRKDLEHRLD